MDNIQTFSSLKRSQKEALGLLSVGTFLEYFDLMLYVHMAVLLNELFFPKTDPHISKLLAAFAFCSTYLLRPFGALIFGWIGDNIGRKVVVIITTIIMAICCIIIATLPTYAQIGISAAYILTACRMVQGLTATAELRGAELYLTESSRPPIQYPLVASITVFSAVGTTAALGIASIFTDGDIFANNTESWRIAFFVGAVVAIIGTVGRTSLKEADEFSKKKHQLEQRLADNNVQWSDDVHTKFTSQKMQTITAIAYFFIQCARPPCFYFIYVYCAHILKQRCNFTAHQVINQNFWVSIIDFLGISMLVYLSYKIHPLKILKAKFYLFFASIALFPIILTYADTVNPMSIFIFQSLAALFVFDHIPASPIFYKYFPVFKRFMYTSFLSATAKLLTYLTVALGFVYTERYFSYWGIFVIFIPVGIGFFISLSYFQKLEHYQDESLEQRYDDHL